jgi:hypothetical protein
MSTIVEITLRVMNSGPRLDIKLLSGVKLS